MKLPEIPEIPEIKDEIKKYKNINYLEGIFIVFALRKINLSCDMPIGQYKKLLNDPNKLIKASSYVDVFVEQSFFVESGKKFITDSELILDEFCNSDNPLDYKLKNIENLSLHLKALSEIHNKENSFQFQNLINNVYIKNSNENEATRIDLSRIDFSKKTLAEIYKWYAIRKEFFSVLTDKVQLYKNDMLLRTKELKTYITNKDSDRKMFRLIHEIVLGMEAANLITIDDNHEKLIHDLKLVFGITRDEYVSKITNNILNRKNPTMQLDNITKKLYELSKATKKMSGNKKQF